MQPSDILSHASFPAFMSNFVSAAIDLWARDNGGFQITWGDTQVNVARSEAYGGGRIETKGFGVEFPELLKKDGVSGYVSSHTFTLMLAIQQSCRPAKFSTIYSIVSQVANQSSPGRDVAKMLLKYWDSEESGEKLGLRKTAKIEK